VRLQLDRGVAAHRLGNFLPIPEPILLDRMQKLDFVAAQPALPENRTGTRLDNEKTVPTGMRREVRANGEALQALGKRGAFGADNIALASDLAAAGAAEKPRFEDDFLWNGRHRAVANSMRLTFKKSPIRIVNPARK
jgi:hypothetical protein